MKRNHRGGRRVERGEAFTPEDYRKLLTEERPMPEEKKGRKRFLFNSFVLLLFSLTVFGDNLSASFTGNISSPGKFIEYGVVSESVTEYGYEITLCLRSDKPLPVNGLFASEVHAVKGSLGGRGFSFYGNGSWGELSGKSFGKDEVSFVRFSGNFTPSLSGKRHVVDLRLLNVSVYAGVLESGGFMDDKPSSDELMAREKLDLELSGSGLTHKGNSKLFVDRAYLFNRRFFVFLVNDTGKVDIEYEFRPDSRIVLGSLERLTSAGWVSVKNPLELEGATVLRQNYANIGLTYEEFNITAAGEKIDPVVYSWLSQNVANVTVCYGDWEPTFPCANTFDQNWDSLGYAAYPVKTGYRNITLIKPPGVNKGSYIEYKDGAAWANYSLSDYWREDLDNLTFLMESHREAGTYWNKLHLQNVSATELITLYSHSGGADADSSIFDALLWWNISLNLSNCSILPADANYSSNLTANASWNGLGTLSYLWILNGNSTGNDSSVYSNISYGQTYTLQCTVTYGGTVLRLNSSNVTVSDPVDPVMADFNVSSLSVSDGDTVYFYLNASDAGSGVSWCRAEVNDSAGTFSDNVSMSLLSGTTYRGGKSFNTVGNWSFKAAHCADAAGNTAHNWSVNVTVEVSAAPTPTTTPSSGSNSGSGVHTVPSVPQNGSSADYLIHFRVLPSVIKPSGLQDFLPNMSFWRVVRIENQEVFDLAFKVGTTCGNLTPCVLDSCVVSLPDNLTITGGSNKELKITCTAPINASRGETYYLNLEVTGCRTDNPALCDTRITPIRLKIQSVLVNLGFLTMASPDFDLDPVVYVLLFFILGSLTALTIWVIYTKKNLIKIIQKWIT